MPTNQINDQYLRSFFGIDTSPAGDAELAALREKLIRKKFGQGQDICTIDGEADGMYFLESGTAVVLDREGEQINILHEGQYFGEYAVLSGQRRLSTVRSLGTTVVYQLQPDDMMEILRRHPGVYGDFMKQVYAQVSRKHKQLISLTRLHRGILQHPDNLTPLTPKRMLIQYGALALLFVLSYFFVPRFSAAPIFLLPLALMIVYVLITHRTLESLIVAGIYAAFLTLRSGIVVSYTDALLDTLYEADSVETTFILLLLGAFVSLIEASGAVTAFKKLADRHIRSPRGARLAILLIMLVTSVDDSLNSLCAASSTNSAAEEQRISCEDRSLMLSFLPTVLCSFVPISLWGIFVISTLPQDVEGGALRLFISSIPFNFFSLIVLIAMLLHCFGLLPKSSRLKQAEKRIEDGGELWPSGSERFLLQDDGEVWGKLSNLLLPVVVLVAASLSLRSIFDGGFALDFSCGLVAAILFMFLLYCAQGMMTPEQFMEHMLAGIQGMMLPIILYLLTICFCTLLTEEALGDYFNALISALQPAAALFPAALFLISLLLTVALGSSWAMFVLSFPAAIQIATAVGLNCPLCVGAVCAAGLAGELCCVFTGDYVYVGESIGCNPDAVLSVRMPYAICFSLVSLILYAIAGIILH